MKMDRRGFLSRLLGWIGAGVSLLWLRPAVSEAKSGPDWYKVGKLEDFEIGKPTLVQKGRHVEKDITVRLGAMYVIRKADGVQVLSAVCTHAGCDVKLNESGGFSCPCHGAQFDAQGAVVKGPARRALDTLPSRVENGEVLVFTSK